MQPKQVEGRDPLRVYVGCEAEQTLPFRVLAHSLRKHASGPVEVRSLGESLAQAGIRIPVPRSRRHRQHTPFSFQRFAIPELAGRKGPAIYLDSDMLVFEDIYKLLALAPPSAAVAAAHPPAGSGRSPQISVMVMHCDDLDWNVARMIEGLDAGRHTYEGLFQGDLLAPTFSRCLPSAWNDLERYDPGVTCLTHFTDMDTQPWLYAGSPLCPLWVRALLETIDAGEVAADEVQTQAAMGWIRPSLAEQVLLRLPDPKELPAGSLDRDARTFTPPHRIGLLKARWLRTAASALIDYGNPRPGAGARCMRRLHAAGYRAYRFLKGSTLYSPRRGSP